MDLTVATLTARADLYRLFAVAFYSPCKEWGEECLFGNIASLLSESDSEATPIAQELAAAWEDSDLEGLSVEAAHLFVGPFGVAVPPYGSCYLEEEHRVMGDSTMEVGNFYREWGLDLAPDTKDLPDHIAIELEFMNFLAHRQAQACADGKAEEGESLEGAQRDFMVRWLLPFAKAMTARIAEATEVPFFQLLGKALLTFLQEQAALLSKGNNPASPKEG